MNLTLLDTIDGELNRLALACANAEAFQQSEMLAKGWKAVAALPPELRHAILPGFVGATRFSQLLAAGAHETAAIEMLGDGIGFMASRSPYGGHFTTVFAPGGEEITQPAETLALGLVGGLMQLLRALNAGQGGSTSARH